jgi:hypothetical protein
VLITDAHPGYLTFQEFEANQARLAELAAARRQQPAQRREQRTVGGLQPGPGVLAAQHRQLLA